MTIGAKGGGFALVCGHCAVEFRSYRPGTKFCSPTCYHAARSAAVPVVPCAHCLAPVRAKMHGGAREKFCSAECSREYHRRENHPNWKGGRGIDSAGYVRVTLPDGRRVREHRLVAAGMLGRPPLPTEHVHHGNENKQDNAPTNLEVLAPSEHARIHAPRVSPNPHHRAKRARDAH